MFSPGSHGCGRLSVVSDTHTHTKTNVTPTITCDLHTCSYSNNILHCNNPTYYVYGVAKNTPHPERNHDLFFHKVCAL